MLLLLFLLLLLLCYLAHYSYSIHRAANARLGNHRRGERRRLWTYWRDNSATGDLTQQTGEYVERG